MKVNAPSAAHASRINSGSLSNTFDNSGIANNEKKAEKQIMTINKGGRLQKQGNVKFGSGIELIWGFLGALATGIVAASVGSAIILFSLYVVMGISVAVDNRRKRKAEKLKASVLNDVAKIAEKNPHMTKKQADNFYKDRLDGIRIEPSNSGHERGLNKVVGFSTLKYDLAKMALMPLIEALDGKKTQSLIPNGICFFGPPGTGKTYLAEAMGDHYKKFGGHFEKIRFSDDDVKMLERTFKQAQEHFTNSGKKKYTIILLDEVEKELDKSKSGHSLRVTKLSELTNNAKDKGVVFVTTSNKLESLPPQLLRDGRTDMRVPVGPIEDFELADMINFTLKKLGIAHAKIDYAEVLDSVKTNKLKYKPKELESALKDENRYISAYGGYMTTDTIKKALKEAAPEFNEREAEEFRKSKEYARQQGAVYEY